MSRLVYAYFPSLIPYTEIGQKTTKIGEKKKSSTVLIPELKKLDIHYYQHIGITEICF